MKSRSDNIFEVPVDNGYYCGSTLFYAPLTHRVSFSPLEALPGDNILPQSLKSVKDLRKMSVLPNHKCNFSCSYCYAANGRNNDELSEVVAKKALDFFIDNERINRPLSLAILGGGEPLLSWHVTRPVIEYSRKRSESEGLRLEITVVTNASIVSEDIIDIFLCHNVIVNASFDLIESVQNAQRKNFTLVKDNIRKLSEAGVYTTINSTITPLNVCEMEKMVENAHLWFPKVKYMIFEPVIAFDMFESAYELRHFYDNYISHFISAAKLASDYGMCLTCRILQSLDSCKDRGCDGRFNLCPNGDITICYCTSSKNDPNFENRIYGKVNVDGIEIFNRDFERLCEENVYSLEKCANCFAKFNCAGGCMLPNDRYSEEYKEEICRFNRNFICYELLKRVSK